MPLSSGLGYSSRNPKGAKILRQQRGVGSHCLQTIPRCFQVLKAVACILCPYPLREVHTICKLYNSEIPEVEANQEKNGRLVTHLGNKNQLILWDSCLNLLPFPFWKTVLVRSTSKDFHEVISLCRFPAVRRIHHLLSVLRVRCLLCLHRTCWFRTSWNI